MGFLAAQQAVLPLPSQQLQSAARRKELARRLHTRSVPGPAQVSLTPCQPQDNACQQTSGAAGEDFWRKHTLTNGSLCHNHSSFVSVCHSEMSHLCLKDVGITSVVSMPSAARASVHRVTAERRLPAKMKRELWKQSRGCMAPSLDAFHRQRARDRLLRPDNVDVVKPPNVGDEGKAKPEQLLKCLGWERQIANVD